MKTVAVIPARGGSKRIPRKNIRPFLGKPIIAYSIETARQTKLFDEIIVSTDDDEIAAVAKQCGASVPFIRPPEISDDQTGMTTVAVHAVRELEKTGGEISSVCLLHAAAPLMRPQDVIAGHEKLQAGGKNIDLVFSATTFASPILRAFSVEGDGTAKMFWPENYEKNSQDLPVAYHDAAQFYWMTRDALFQDIMIFSNHALAHLIPRHRVVDIDTPEDWRQAEIIFRGLGETGSINVNSGGEN